MAEAEYIVFEDFSGGMNTQIARQGMPEKFASWMENLQPVAGNFLLAVPGPDAALATLAGEIVVRQQPALIGTTSYIINFCASGAAYAVTVIGNGNGVPATGGVVTKFAVAGTFSPGGGDVISYNAQRILIADRQAGYSTWDGTSSGFVKQGAVSPNIQITAGGSGYTSGASGTISGGSGSGATVSVQVTAGVVTGITLVGPGIGYLASDTLTLTINAIGAGSGATANAHVWPFVSPNPTTIAIAFGRVWLASGRTLIVTGAGSATFGAGFDDFATADASVTLVLSDVDLQQSITALRFLNNYLYIIGDNSVKAIGSISVVSSVTNFTITTLSSDQGTIYLQTVLSYNRLVLFANTVGVFAVFGASVEKISDQMDGIFRATDFTQPLQAAVNDVNNIHTYLLLLRYIDPVAGTRSLILAFASKRWYVLNQGNSVRAITTSVLGGITETFASSGADVTQIIQSPTAGVAYKLSTSLTAHGNPIRDKRVVRAGIAATVTPGSSLVMTVDTEPSSIVVPLNVPLVAMIFTNPNGTLVFTNPNGTLLFIATGFALAHSGALSATGRYVGATLTGIAVGGFALQAVMLEVQPGAPWGKG